MNGLTWFLLGFGVATLLSWAWHHWLVKPQLEALKKLATDKLSGK